MKTGWAILVACGGLAISGCSGEDPVAPGGTGGSGGGGTPSEKVPPVTTPAAYTILSGADAMAGAAPPAKYASVCGSCHQPAGQGFAQIAPEIRHTPAAFASWVVRNGRGPTFAMAAFPPTSTDPKVTPITDAELTEMITWSNSLPKPTTGQGLYMDMCGNCHGPMSANGGRVGVALKPGILGATVDSAVRGGLGGSDPSMRELYMPAFDATLLTDAELALIKTYMGAM